MGIELGMENRRSQIVRERGREGRSISMLISGFSENCVLICYAIVFVFLFVVVRVFVPVDIAKNKCKIKNKNRKKTALYITGKFCMEKKNKLCVGMMFSCGR